MFKTENQLRILPCQPEQRLVLSNWKDGFISVEETMQFSVSQTEFYHFISWDISSKYSIISHTNINLLDDRNV